MTGNKRPGFTVVEMLVAITIFSTIAVIMAQTFVGFNQLHRRVAYTATLGQDARFLNELITREARNKMVDYSAGPILPHDTQLSLISRDGTQTIRIALLEPSSGFCGILAVRCVGVSNDNGVTWNPITSNRVNVKQFDIYVRPTNDPFNQLAPENDQPFVTVTTKFEYFSDNPKERPQLQTQTTAASRMYLR